MAKGFKPKNQNNWTWISWLHNCKEAWETEGVNCSIYAKECHNYLVRVDKQPGESKIQIAAKAWKLYNEELGR